MALRLRLAAILGLIFMAASVHAFDEGFGVMSKNPSFSPSGNEIAFEADFGGPLNIWASTIGGANLRKLTNGVSDEEPAWSPTGTAIAFASLGSAATDIWTIRPDGSGLTQLTSKSLNNRQPAWSPNASLIAFVSDRGGTNDVWIMNADGTSQRRLTTLPGEEDHPSFSPSGTQIVFGETVNDSSVLMVINTDGTGLRTLTTAGFNDWNPSWTSNGILFSSNRDTTSEHSKIWRIQPDGTGQVKIGDVIGLDPVQLPNGHILFSDEITDTGAVATVTDLDVVSGTRRIINDIRGRFTPIDIRPESPVNAIDPSSKGTVLVAILSRPGFDATVKVDISTLAFGHSGTERSFVGCEKNFRDVNRDGLADLICRFNIQQAGFRLSDTRGILLFQDLDGSPFEGIDSIQVVTDDNLDGNE
jgi:dipeptidyl aminopeptidase/acylaminoacyl peptidase